MNLLNRYLLARFASNLITVASGFVAIYLLVDFFEKIDNFNEHGGTFSLALRFFLLNIPFILDQLGPVLILLAGVITFGVLNHSNELRALKAGGIPLVGIISPLLIGALMTTTLFLINAQYILPVTVSTTNHIWYEQLHDEVPVGIYRGGRYYYRGAEGFYSFRWKNSDAFSFSHFSYSQWGEGGYQLKYLLSARQATWVDGVWTLNDGQTQQLMEDGTFHYQTFTQQQEVLPESPDKFFIPEYRSAEMSISDLLHEARDKSSNEERTIAWANFSSRLSYIFLGIPLLLLGLPVLIFSYRKWGQDLAIAIPASCLLAFFAWGLWGTLQSFAKAGFISPLVSSTAVHLIFASIGIILLRRENR